MKELAKDRQLVIVDLDGTLALIDHRRHLVSNGRNDWDEFYRQCVNDLPNVPVIKLVQALRAAGYLIMILSGRSVEVQNETIEWLIKNKISYDFLRMRPPKNYTPDEQLKREWTACIDKRRILCVIDDRQKVVDMWRSEGLTCLQVAPGNF